MSPREIVLWVIGDGPEVLSLCSDRLLRAVDRWAAQGVATGDLEPPLRDEVREVRRSRVLARRVLRRYNLTECAALPDPLTERLPQTAMAEIEEWAADNCHRYWANDGELTAESLAKGLEAVDTYSDHAIGRAAMRVWAEQTKSIEYGEA